MMESRVEHQLRVTSLQRDRKDQNSEIKGLTQSTLSIGYTGLFLTNHRFKANSPSLVHEGTSQSGLPTVLDGYFKRGRFNGG